jgi:PBSX family phage terminase large subunit
VSKFTPLQWQVAPWKDRAPVLLLGGSAGGGKALAIDTEIPTPKGWSTMERLCVGDYVFDEHGKPTRIESATGIMHGHDVFEVEFDDGSIIVADADHQWLTSTVASRASKRNNPLPPSSPSKFGRPQKRAEDSIVTTREMSDNVRVFARTNFSIVTCGILEYPPRPVPIHPYVLGYLLGDGYLPQCSFTTNDSEIVGFMQHDLGPEYELHKSGRLAYYICSSGIVKHGSPVMARRGRAYKHSQANCFVAMMRRPGGRSSGEEYLGTFNTHHEAEVAVNRYKGQTHSEDEINGCGIRNDLRILGLTECRSASKFIPEIYRINSPEIRLALLRGLMDSDGHIDAKRGRGEFLSISKELAFGVFELLCSFGIKPTIIEKRAKLYGKDCGPCWRVMFTDGIQVFRLQRKADRVKGKFRPTQRQRYVINVKSVPSVPVRCIQVASKSGLFLAGRSMIPTHNSRIAAEKIHACCLKYPGSCWLILRKAAEWTRKSIIPFYWQSVIAGTRGVTYSKSEGSFHYVNGSIVYSGGMADDKQRESIRSIGGAGGLDGAWMEEGNAFTRQDYEELQGRLRHTAAPFRQLIITTNPGGSKHWINEDLIKGKQAAFYRSCAAENSYNPEDYVSKLDQMTGVMRQRLALGLWVTAEGAVYEMFDSTPGGIHVQVRSVGDMRRFYLAMDEGFTNPSVILVVGEDGDGRWHVFREFYQAGVRQETVVKTALEWYREFSAELVVVDAAAAGLIADLQSCGLNAKGGKGRVLDGISRIQNRLAMAGDGRARLTFDPSAQYSINEMESYMWRPAKDVPEKADDHAPDAIRYLADVTESLGSGGFAQVVNQRAADCDRVVLPRYSRRMVM